MVLKQSKDGGNVVSKKRNINRAWYKRINLYALILLSSFVVWVALVTHQNKYLTNMNPFVLFAVENHTSIMVGSILASTVFGFLWSHTLYAEIKKKKRSSITILDTVLLFLGDEEKAIIDFLVAQGGGTTQSEISRLPGMNRVKAFRSLQKMEGKRLIDITHHGKIRKIALKEEIFNVLLESNR